MDRNSPSSALKCTKSPSLSARRAWIEILKARTNQNQIYGSLSARRAWIEIAQNVAITFGDMVALRKESVDRNWTDLSTTANFAASLSARRAWIEMAARGRQSPLGYRRSPQGERG